MQCRWWGSEQPSCKRFPVLSMVTGMSKETPLMKQYNEIKAHHLDKILFFRMGDFYEMFGADAEKAAPILGIALTQRNKKSEDSPQMCGMPYHSASGAINKLLSVGLKVAICEQVEDPATAKGIVKRAVTQVLTPGVVYDYTTLNQSKSHYLACYENETLAFLEASTGEFFYFEVPQVERALEFVQFYPVAELVVFDGTAGEGFQFDELTKLPVSKLTEKIDSKILADLVHIPEAVLQNGAVCSLLSYLYSLSGAESVKVIRVPQKKTLDGVWNLSQRLQKQLEIFQNNAGDDHPTVFSCLDRTQTSSGRRLLRSWLLSPLRDLNGILERQRHIQSWKQDFPKLKQLRKILSGVGDIERRFVRLTSVQANARDLSALASAVIVSLDALEFAGYPTGDFQKLLATTNKIKNTLLEELPLQIKQGYLIQSGVSAELDELISLSQNAQSYLEKYEAKQKEVSGINSLKVRYNQVFGYYIEITNSHLTKVPESYKRKQTLANAERFYTDELLELEKKILSSQTKRFEMEHQMFVELKEEILQYSFELSKLAIHVSELDIYSAMAWLSLERNYCVPTFVDDQIMSISGLKHFVLDQIKANVVASDLMMREKQVLLITGPNMAGKSTVMRQLALAVIVAQCGFDVPAKTCRIPLFDQIFTRIGANDALAQGLSTFMVEMTETAELIAGATPRSLVILDEIGRGTSTYDGLSLAQAILEHLIENNQCLCLFATHYHELTKASERFSQIINAHMETKETKEGLQFTYRLKPGPVQKSFGVLVAQSAGLPKELIHNAKKILSQLEKPAPNRQINLFEWVESDAVDSHNHGHEADPREQYEQEVLHELAALDLNAMTPMACLLKIHELQKKLQQKRAEVELVT